MVSLYTIIHNMTIALRRIAYVEALGNALAPLRLPLHAYGDFLMDNFVNYFRLALVCL